MKVWWLRVFVIVIAGWWCGVADGGKSATNNRKKKKKKKKKTVMPTSVPTMAPAFTSAEFENLLVSEGIVIGEEGGDQAGLQFEVGLAGLTLSVQDGLRIVSRDPPEDDRRRHRRLEDCLEGGFLRFGTTDDSFIGIGETCGSNDIPSLMLQNPIGIRLMGPLGEPTSVEFGALGECRITPVPGRGIQILDPDGVRILTSFGLPPVGRRRRLDDCKRGDEACDTDTVGAILSFGPTDKSRIVVNPAAGNGPLGVMLQDPVGLRLVDPDGTTPTSILFGPTDLCRIQIGPNAFSKEGGMMFKDPYGFFFDNPLPDSLAQVGVNGDVSANNFLQTSSRRFKTNIRHMSDAMEKLLKLRGVYFNWKAGGKSDLGFIAEEVADVFPEAVAFESDGSTVKGVKYANLVAVAVEAVKTQQEYILELQGKVNQFQAKFATQETRLDELEAELKVLKKHIQGASA